MIQWFEKNKKYTEPEINDIIKSKIECRDHATLRRDLVDNKLLNTIQELIKKNLVD